MVTEHSATSARWPRKPPKDARCDAHLGWHTDPYGAPVLDRCPNPAIETAKDTTFGHEMWLCDSCVTALETKGHVARNPRRRAA